jgi:3-dehydroquinate synthetase
MLYANILAKNLNILKDDFLSVEVSDFLKKVLLDYKLDNLDFETIYTSMKQDKKNDN